MGKYVATDLTTIYQAPTADQAEMELMAFEEKWDKTHPTIGQTWRRNWERITPFFAYPPDIRKVIYTTNAIESQNMSLRKVTKNRGSFPNDESMLKLLYLALNNIAKKWTLPIRDRKAGLEPLLHFVWRQDTGLLNIKKIIYTKFFTDLHHLW